jgi:pimeloyl-ACP methyl ester carboxylesterase
MYFLIGCFSENSLLIPELNNFFLKGNLQMLKKLSILLRCSSIFQSCMSQHLCIVNNDIKSTKKMTMKKITNLIAVAVLLLTSVPSFAQVWYKTIKVDGLNIAYREAGNPASPKIVLLHGFPAGSHQYRDLIQSLSDKFHVIAPDYPGFGLSDMPDPATYNYTFEGISQIVEHFLQLKGFDHYGLFAQDYGGPVGFRIVGRNPKVLDWLIIQNTNAYEVGFTAAWDGFRGALWKNRSEETEKPLAGFLTHDAIKSIYLFGAKNPDLISPDNWESDYGFMQRPNAVRVNLNLFYDYRTNVELYSVWQEFLRKNQPKTLIFWGQKDIFFTPAGGEAYLKDLPKAEMHRLDAGHFAVEDNLAYISKEMHRFYTANVAGGK